MADPAFWRGKTVLLTGHTGFKGAWAACWLTLLGAKVTGVALPPHTNPNLFTLAQVDANINSVIADIRDKAQLAEIVREVRPQIIIHMAAQALVRQSYQEPLATLEANIMGTANLLEAARRVDTLDTILVITSDKVYQNSEQNLPFAEEDRLGGHDPYSMSKAAAELVTASFTSSFFADTKVNIATARGGNVIGGGDFSIDRIVPDIWRAALDEHPLILRYPEATRPWQHVLDCLNGYFLYIEKLSHNEPQQMPRSLNFGPTGEVPISVSQLTDIMQEALQVPQGWQQEEGPLPKEMKTLSLNTSKARTVLDWHDHLPDNKALEWTATWYLELKKGSDLGRFTTHQITSYMDLK
ncbi:MAG: CDP-glucose 4,6-dehydratase [bacterium]|nr:CDP-glucose 4,6-dehydratase [bacterium]